MIDIVDLSRLQFAMTAMYHFLFVPLTLGMAFLLAILESLYVMTNKQIYKDMTKFWGKLFGINFALGVATGLTMEFQFGTNWAYYSHYVGDIFGAPLAIEGLMAFFLEMFRLRNRLEQIVVVVIDQQVFELWMNFFLLTILRIPRRFSQQYEVVCPDTNAEPVDAAPFKNPESNLVVFLHPVFVATNFLAFTFFQVARQI